MRSTAADPFKENMDYFVVYTLLSSILGHGSKLMAINLLRFDLCLGRSPLPGRPRPTGFPHAHPRISNILGHGSKLMAISLLAIWLVPWPKPRLGLRPRQWPEAQGHGHGLGRSPGLARGLGNGLKPKAMAWPRPQAGSQERKWVMAPNPRQCPQASGHGQGSRPWPWLGP